MSPVVDSCDATCTYFEKLLIGKQQQQQHQPISHTNFHDQIQFDAIGVITIVRCFVFVYFLRSRGFTLMAKLTLVHKQQANLSIIIQSASW